MLFLHFFAARNEKLGRESLAGLEQKGLKVHFHQLDITCERSIAKFAAFLKAEYGGLDILVNNAGFAYKVCVMFATYRIS